MYDHLIRLWESVLVQILVGRSLRLQKQFCSKLDLHLLFSKCLITIKLKWYQFKGEQSLDLEIKH